jgi:uncharacterized protein DUF927
MRNGNSKIIRRTTGMFLIKGGVNGEKAVRVADTIRLKSLGTRCSNNTTLAEIQFTNIEGNRKNEMFEFSYLLPEKRSEIKVRVANQGYVWPEDRDVSSAILKQLAATRPKTRFFLVSAPGWHQGQFVVWDEVFGPRGREIDFRLDPDSDAHIGAFKCGKGSLKGWQKSVAKPARNSSCLRVAIAAAFAAPLLRLMNMDSFAINWFSDTSDGKTSMLFIAASVAGLIDGGLPGWADSEAAMEDQARGHRDCLCPLDESADGTGKVSLEVKARTLAFMIARNRPRKLSKKYERDNALQDREWRIIVLSSSERALTRVAIDSGGRRLGGEEVRLIDVPASEPGSLGIFDGKIKKQRKMTDCESSKKLIEQMRVDAESNQGFAFRKFLRNYVDDAEAVSKVIRYKEQFEFAVNVPAANAALRIRSNFALLWAAAAMAIDYRVLPWKKSCTFRAVEKCFRKALTVINPSKSTEPVVDAPARIATELYQKLQTADLRDVVLRQKVTAKQAQLDWRPMDFESMVTFISNQIG